LERGERLIALDRHFHGGDACVPGGMALLDCGLWRNPSEDSHHWRLGEGALEEEGVAHVHASSRRKWSAISCELGIAGQSSTTCTAREAMRCPRRSRRIGS